MVAVPLFVEAGEMLPQADAQRVPLCVSVQVTPLFAGSFVTVGVNCCVPLTTTEAVGGVTETRSGATVTISEADLVMSDAEVAVTVTVRFAETEAGAV